VLCEEEALLVKAKAAFVPRVIASGSPTPVVSFEAEPETIEIEPLLIKSVDVVETIRIVELRSSALESFVYTINVCVARNALIGVDNVRGAYSVNNATILGILCSLTIRILECETTNVLSVREELEGAIGTLPKSGD
jgi:hypothetical protein